MKQIVKQILPIITIVLVINGCSSIEKIPCERIENGIKITEIVIVQRHYEKIYQPAIKTTEEGLKTTIAVLDQFKISDLNANVKTNITELRDKLDQFSSRAQDIIRASYLALQTFPCDKDVRKRHFDLLDNIAKENSALEKLKTQLTSIINKGTIGGVDENKVQIIIQDYYARNGEKIFTN